MAPAPLRRRTEAPPSPRSDRGASSGSLPSLGSLLDADRAWPSISAASSDSPSAAWPGPQARAASPGRTGASVVSSPVSSDALQGADDAAPASARDRADVEKIIVMLGSIAQGKKLSHLRDADGLSLAVGFTPDGQLKPRGGQQDPHVERLHAKLRRLRAGTAQDRAVLHDLKHAMRRAGQRSWQRTAEILEGLIEGSALLEGGYVASKAELEHEWRSRGLPHVASAVRKMLLRGGVVVGPEHGNKFADAVRGQVERLRSSGERSDLVREWDELEATQAARQRQAAMARARPSRPHTQPVDLDRRARILMALKPVLLSLADDEAQTVVRLGGKAESSRFKALFDFEGGLKRSAHDYFQPLRDSVPAHRQAVEEIEQASVLAVQGHRDRNAVILRALARAVMDIKSRRRSKVAAMRDLASASPKARSILTHAIDKAGFPSRSAAAAARVANLLECIDRLSHSADAQHRDAARVVQAALDHDARTRPPTVGRPARADSPPGRTRAPASPDLPFELPDLDALSPLSPISLPGSPLSAHSPDSEHRPAIDPTRRPESEPDFDALPALSGVELSLVDAAPEGAPADAPFAQHPLGVLRANATRDWVGGLVRHLPSDYRRALVEQAIGIELDLFARQAPPLRDMLQNRDARLWDLVVEPWQADTIRQLDALARPREP